MKKALLSIIAILLLAPLAMAQDAWTVRSVPNTRLQGNEIHVSDPDGYLSDSTESVINAALSSIREQADVFVVTLYSIGNDEPKHFATSLFNYWGIGDAATDNGVLLLFVEDQRALEFETGYGAEATLTDARCSMIFNNTIVPYFRAGDYEGGLCAGVADIVDVFGGSVPDEMMGLLSSRSQSTGGEGNGEDSDIDLGGTLITLVLCMMAVVVPFISFFRWIAGLLKGKKKGDNTPRESTQVFEEDGIKYIKAISTGWKSSVWEGKGFLRFLVYGVGALVIFLGAMAIVPNWFPSASETRQDFWAMLIGWVGYFSFTGLIQNSMLMSKAKATAANASSPRAIYTQAKKDGHSLLARVMAPWLGIPFSVALKKRIENSVQCVCPTCGGDMMKMESFELPPMRAAEEAAGGYHFTPCRCPQGHTYVLRENGSNFSSVQQCKSCGAFAMKSMGERTTVHPTYTSQGIKETTYECQYCHRQQKKTSFIPRLTRTTSSSSGSHHSGGSFGGGHSGGGGYSGRW